MSLLALTGCTVAPDMDIGSSGAGVVVTDRCAIEGLGMLPNGDTMLGSVRGGDTGATGTWTHISAGHGVILAVPDWILCRINGSTLGDFAGAATVAGVSGYTYRVSIQDRGVPGPPVITPGTPTVETLRATLYYGPTRFVDGSLPITDLARITIPGELPVSVGAPGTGRADLVIQRHDTADTVTCRYHGNGRSSRGGDRYVLRHCVGLHGLPEVMAGDTVDVTSAVLHVQSGDRRSVGCTGETTVEVNLDVIPLTVVEPRRDYYRIAVFDSTGVRVILSEGDLSRGDITLTQLD